MKFSFCNELFQKWEVKRMADYLVQLGYQGVEIAPWVYFSSPQDFWKSDKILRELEDAGLRVVGLHWLFGENSSYYINHPDLHIREKTSAYFVDLVKLCADLRGEVMIIGSPNQRKVKEGITYEQAWGYTKECLRKPLEIARDRGITLCMEPLSRDQTNFLNTSEEALKFVKEVDHPCLALIVDMYSLSKEGKPMDEIILSTKGYLKHFHADDANKCGPGTGETDFVPLARALREIDYQGYVSVEVHDLTVDPEETASRSIKYMKDCLAAD